MLSEDTIYIHKREYTTLKSNFTSITVRNLKSRKIKVGLPRALLYYKFFPLWITFFEELGAEVITSPPTNKKIKNLGISNAPDEDCYSTKLFHGHVLSLSDKVDYIFIPRFQSEHHTNVCCPKFVSLAEVIHTLHPELPPIIMPTYSQAKLGHGKGRIIRIGFLIGRIFTKNPFKILRALIRAFKTFQLWKEDKILTLEELEEWIQGKIYVNTPPPIKENKKSLKIALVGHPYMINDPYASLEIKNKLIQMGADLITSEQIPRTLVEKQMHKLDFNMYFDYERELLGTVMHFLGEKSIDGIIHIIIFSCGPDSIAGEMVTRFSNRNSDVPV